TETLWNWMVESPLFMLWRCFGTRDRSCWQSKRSSPLSVVRRVVHCDEMFLKLPSERTRPPSEPSKKRSGLFGLTTNACWSGCIPTGATGLAWQQLPGGVGGVVESHVMSLNDAPASVEERTPRPFVANPYVA